MLLFLVGIAEFLGISTFATPPTVSMERESGVTSMRIISEAEEPAASAAPPLSFSAWTAAPRATHSSGFRDFEGSRPVSCFTLFWTAGIRVEPPTIMTLLRSAARMPASFRAVFTGPAVRSTRSLVSSSNCARVMVICRCFGPPFLSVVINGRLISVCAAEERLIFALAASSRTL